MKKDVRDFLKRQNEIVTIKHDSQQERCQTCLFHSKEKVCQIHGLKTNAKDVCSQYTFPSKKKVYLGGKL